MKKIFLVEDDSLFAMTVEKGLSKDSDFEVTKFRTGEELFKFLDKEKETPDIIVLDYNLNSVEKEAMTGGEVLGVLKTKYKKRIDNAPIIILSGLTEVKAAVDLLKKGAKDFILKDNVFLENLKKSLNNIIELRQLRAEMGLYKNETNALKKRLWLTVGVILLSAAAVAAYFLWFNS